MELRLIDGIGPFFVPVKRRRLNWSKIPFHDLPVGEGSEDVWRQIADDLAEFAEAVQAEGFNVITLDDVAHVTGHPWLEETVALRTAFFAEKFHELVSMLREKGLRVFMTSDVVTLSPGVVERLGSSRGARRAFYLDVLRRFFREFPEVEGVILRIGESDGLDVHDQLRSELHLRSAKEANEFLKEVLPIAEAEDRTVILRTWTVGAHRIGDLIWRTGTLERLVEGIDSDHFVLSMKPGDTDFFRYLPLNEAFRNYRGLKILELQARPEYEGAGELPTFLGYEYEGYRNALREVENVVGVSVWCQTGGWHRFRRMSFFGEGSPWVELNARVAMALFSGEESVDEWLGGRGLSTDFFRKLHLVIREGYYLPAFASQRIFFRRVRIPPLLHVYWDTIFFIAPVRKLMRYFVPEREEIIARGSKVGAVLDELVDEVQEMPFPDVDLEFMRDTFAMMDLARQYYFGPYSAALVAEIEQAKKAYKKRWPKGGEKTRFRIRTDFAPSRLKRRTLRWGGRVMLRRRQAYRFLDYAFVLTLLGFCYRVFRRAKPDALPEFVRESAMGVDSLFE
ncbi:MAG: hypothetical protein PVJ98_02385 [Akkermansiaceae bacterium]|jgi:hypothetical protein